MCFLLVFEVHCQSSYLSRGYCLDRWGWRRVSKFAVPSSWFQVHNTKCAEPLNWSWNWDEGFCWAHRKAEVLEMEVEPAVWPEERNTSAGNWYPLPGKNERLTLRQWPCWISGLKQGIAVLGMGLKVCCANPCDLNSSLQAFIYLVQINLQNECCASFVSEQS